MSGASRLSLVDAPSMDATASEVADWFQNAFWELQELARGYGASTLVGISLPDPFAESDVFCANYGGGFTSAVGIANRIASRLNRTYEGAIGGNLP